MAKRWFQYAYGKEAKLVKCRQCTLTFVREEAEGTDKCPKCGFTHVVDKKTNPDDPRSREEYNPHNS